MAGRYSKFYSRRGTSRGGRQPTQASILFDNLMEVGNNKRPTAAKSAGTVGRWGITSFTSLRSTNTNGSRDEPSTPTNKRMRVEYPSQPIPTSGQDPFSIGVQDPATQPKSAARPRKFFKSRGADTAAKEAEIISQASYMNNEQSYTARGSDNQYPARKQYASTDRPKPSKFFGHRSKTDPPAPTRSYSTRQTAPPSPPPLLSDTSLQAEVKPPIRLRIFKNKGTSHLVSETQVFCADDESNPSYYTAQSPDENHESDNTSETNEPLQKFTDEDQSVAPNGSSNILPEPMPEEESEEEEEVLDDEADKEKLMKAEELLSDTYTDFSVTEKLLLDPKDIPPSTSKTVIENDWFSENETSNDTPEPENLQTIGLLPTTLPPFISHSEPTSQTLASEPIEPTEQQSLSQPELGCQEPHPLRKGSIFKSRRLLTTGVAKKRLALYKHKWTDDKEDKEKAALAASAAQATSTSAAPSTVFDEDFSGTDVLTRVTRPIDQDVPGSAEEVDSVTGVLCSRAARKYYTVVRDVKNAHQMQESGEFDAFNDDVDYILDALADNNSIATRCLSAISLATKCMAPAFRMHVRAHSVVAKFFTALHDSTADPSLALCTATVMFVMSQDQLNMDLDRDSLELMLNLLDTDASHQDALDVLVDQGITEPQLDKNKRKVRELCEEIKSKGHAKHLNLDNITVGNLAMESLLSLTSRRAGEWFKEELRLLGGLEHIVKTVSVCCQALTARPAGQWDDSYLAKLKKIDRCLRVLFNLTSKNLENQLYLLTYEKGHVMQMMLNLMQLCLIEIPIHPLDDPSDKESLPTMLREALLSCMKFLVDLTHNSDDRALGSKMLGEKPGVVDSCLYCLLRMPNYFPEEKQFDIMVVSLCMLINLAELPPSNRTLIINSKAPPEDDDVIISTQGAVDALIDLFIKNEAIAKIEEGKTDAILDSKKEEIIPKEEQATKTPDEIFNDIVEKLLQKAGKNMECNLIQAYIAMLLTYVIMDNKEYESFVREKLPEKNFESMLRVLKKFVNFMVLTISTVSKSRSILDTERLIQYLKMIDQDYVKVDNPDDSGGALDMSC